MKKIKIRWPAQHFHQTQGEHVELYEHLYSLKLILRGVIEVLSVRVFLLVLEVVELKARDE